MATTDKAQHHRDVAEQLLQAAARFGDDDVLAARFNEAAIAHASLAMSEEQRTANLMAVASLGWSLSEAQRLAVAVRLGLA